MTALTFRNIFIKLGEYAYVIGLNPKNDLNYLLRTS